MSGLSCCWGDIPAKLQGVPKALLVKKKQSFAGQIFSLPAGQRSGAGGVLPHTQSVVALPAFGELAAQQIERRQGELSVSVLRLPF